jgi:hypothetical protein
MKRKEIENIVIQLILLVLLRQNEIVYDKIARFYSLLLIRGSLVRAQERELFKKTLQQCKVFFVLKR